MDAAEWGRRTLESAVRGLRPRLADGLRLTAWYCARRGDCWHVRLDCRWEQPGRPGDAAGGRPPARLVRGSGRERGPARLLPGDPRIGRRVRLALAAALTEVAQDTGLGLRVCRWEVRSASSGPRAGGAPAGGCRASAARD